MYKYILTILVFTFLTSSLTAQEEPKDTLKNKSVGIDLFFINNFLPFEGNIGRFNNYLIHHVKHKENGKFIKQAFDIDISGVFENSDLENIERNSSFFSFNYKIGKGKRKNIFKKGYLWYGGELLLDYSQNQRITPINSFISTNPNDVNLNKDQQYSTAVGPFLGFEYNFTPRLSLYTEAVFYLSVQYTISSFESDSPSLQDFKNKTISFQERPIYPSSIILFYNF